MGEFNPNDQENTNRRTVEVLEKIATQLEQINQELRGIREAVNHKVKMDNV